MGKWKYVYIVTNFEWTVSRSGCFILPPYPWVTMERCAREAAWTLRRGGIIIMAVSMS
jgi:hypothetical protein